MTLSVSERSPRLLLLGAGAIALGTGLWAGLGRLGWALPLPALAPLHGPLLICGLFGTLISLERAVALGNGWAYLAPALAAGGTLTLLAGAPLPGAALYVAAALGLTGTTLAVILVQPALFTAALLLGALGWLTGNLFWLLGSSLQEVAGWWLAFLVLTIGAERLELSRLLAPKRGSAAVFLLALAVLLTGAALGIPSTGGAVAFGTGLILLAAWLARHDIARLSIRRAGQARFMAACMLAGYGWLAVAGLVLLWTRFGSLGFGYDVALHSVLIGFVMSMVFGHALIILPAVAGIRLRYSPALYVPLAALHVSVALRVGGGSGQFDSARMLSGPVTVLAIGLFGATLAWTRSRARPAG